MFKAWIQTGVPQKLNPDKTQKSTATTISLPPSSDEVQVLGKSVQSCVTNLLCNHGKLPYHRLRQLKYVERDVINQIVDVGTGVDEKPVKLKCEDCTDGNGIKTETNHQNSEFKIEEEVSENKEGINTQIAEGIPPECDVKVEEKVEIESKSMISLENLMLCEECVVSDLRQHLYDLTLEEDFKKIGNLQNRDPETGWWVVKDDFRNFRKIARQGKLRFISKSYRVQYFWGKVLYFDQSEAWKHLFLASDWSKYATLP